MDPAEKTPRINAECSPSRGQDGGYITTANGVAMSSDAVVVKCPIFLAIFPFSPAVRTKSPLIHGSLRGNLGHFYFAPENALFSGL